MVSQKRREYNRRWLEANREKVRAYRDRTRDERNAKRRAEYASSPERRSAAITSARSWKKNNSIQVKAAQYGVDAWRLESDMNAGCAACGANPVIDASVRLHVDHDHRTGEYRGVLCNSCNLALGHLRDDPIVVSNLLRYLMEASCPTRG